MPTPALPAPHGSARRALLWLVRRLVRVYFRDVEEAGNVPTQATTGRVLLPNHVNGLVDPLLVLATARCPVAPLAKSTLWDIRGLGWMLDVVGAVPIVRRRDDPTKGAGANEALFDRVGGHLAASGNVLVFPEGTSHNEPRLVGVRSGPARMLARAKARGARGLSFQAVALEFDERQTFRSRCLVLYGPVREVDALGLEGEALVAAVTKTVGEDLSELLVEGATWEERLLIARVAELLANDAREPSLARWNDLGRQVEAASAALREGAAPQVEALREAVDGYYAALSQAGLEDGDVAGGAGGPAPRSWWWRAAFAFPLAALGAALYAPPYFATHLAAARLAREQDVVSTYKLAAGLVAYPAWTALLGAAAFAFLPPLAAALTVVGLLGAAFAALAWVDAIPAVSRAFRRVTGLHRLAGLRAARADVMSRVEALRRELEAPKA